MHLRKTKSGEAIHYAGRQELVSQDLRSFRLKVSKLDSLELEEVLVAAGDPQGTNLSQEVLLARGKIRQMKLAKVLC